jgi:formate/nitrite transporter FocA (FNT family)
MLITLSVWSVNYVPEKGLSATVGVMLPIIFFAFCGFDHSVANMLYFYYLGELSWRVVGYIALSILGNILGGIALPLVVKLKKHVEETEEIQRVPARYLNGATSGLTATVVKGANTFNFDLTSEE